MNFLLKIVEGPNKGAEIALVEGVAVSLGKSDDCDIVLADSTLPDAPIRMESAADGVSMNGERLEALAVKTVGATSFAVGPADAPWGALVWPKREEEVASRSDAEAQKPEAAASEKKQEESAPVKRRGGCGGCLIALLVLLLVLAGLGWIFRAEVRPYAETLWNEVRHACNAQSAGNVQPSIQQPDLGAVAAKYGLLLAESNGMARISGNLKTRRERLAATAEAYQTVPGVELDLSDDESFRAAAEDALFTLSEGVLKVAAATNRVLKIVGASSSALKLKKTLESLNADLPKLRNIDVSGVVISHRAAEVHGGEVEYAEENLPTPTIFASPRGKKKNSSSLPVCGILTTPYPCLVMRDGRRLMEGASIGDSVIAEIGVDNVTLTNATGRFTWKP